MPATAKLRYLRITSRKVRLVADLIRGKSVEEAQTILSFTTKKAAPILLKLLKQAVANAKVTSQLEEKNLYISKILVDEGPKYKRWRPRARGVAFPIQKKSSHITFVLEEISKEQVIEKPKKAEVKEVEKVEEIGKVEKEPKTEKPKLRPEIETAKPKIEKGLKRIFRRKSF